MKKRTNTTFRHIVVIVRSYKFYAAKIPTKSTRFIGTNLGGGELLRIPQEEVADVLVRTPARGVPFVWNDKTLYKNNAK